MGSCKSHLLLVVLVSVVCGGFGFSQQPVGEIARYEYYPDGLTKTLQYANGVVSHYDYYANAWLRSLESRTEAGDLVSRYEYDYNSSGNRIEMREWNATLARRTADPLWAAAPSVTKYGYDRLDRLVWVEYHPADASASYRRVEYTYDLASNRLREVAREHAPDGIVLRVLKDRSFRYSRLNRLEAVTDALTPERGTRYLYDAAGNTIARITGGIGPDGEIVPGTEQSRLVFEWDAAARLRRVRQLTPSSSSLTGSTGIQPASPFSVQRSAFDIQRSDSGFENYTEELLAEFRYDYRGRRIAADSRFVALGGDPIPAETRLYIYDEEAVLAEYGFGPDGRTPYKSRQYLYGNELLAVELYAPPEGPKKTGDGGPVTGFEPSSANRPSAATRNRTPGGRAIPTRVPSTRPRGQLISGSSEARMITEEDVFPSSSSRSDSRAPFDGSPSLFDAPSASPASLPPTPIPGSTFDVRFASPASRPPSPVSKLAAASGPRSSVTGLLFYHHDALGSTVNLTAADGAVAEAYLYDAWGNYRELDVSSGSPGPTAPGQLAFAKGPGSGGAGLRDAGENLVIDPDLDENGLYCWATYLAYLQGAFSPSLEPLTSSPAAANRFTYTGHEFDPATGLYYFKARFYDPEIGRFLSEDPYLGDAATPPSLHRFLYAYSNPLRYIDPTGQWTVGNNPKTGRFYVQADSVDRTLENRSSGYSLGRLLDWYVFENEEERQRFLKDVTDSNPWMITEDCGWNSKGLTTGKMILPQGYQLSSTMKQAVLGWVYEQLPYWKKVGRETYVSEEAVLTLQWEMLKQAVMTVCDPLSWYQDANQINEDFKKYVDDPSRTQGAYLTADIAFALLPFVNAREGRIAREALESAGQAGRDARQVERLAAKETEQALETLERPVSNNLSPSALNGGTAGRIGTQNPETAWAARTGRAYDRRVTQFWRKYEGQRIGDWQVEAVNRRIAPGVQPDLVLVNEKTKTIVIHDLTSKATSTHLEKGAGYKRYFEANRPGYTVNYSEGYWEGLEDSWEALDREGRLYFPSTTKPR